MRRLSILQLNEVSFPLVQEYIKAGRELPGFEALVSKGVVTSRSEREYRNIEPWIQWYSFHTGLKFEEHKVFRLGDGAAGQHETIFERLANRGVSVAAMSPMNCGGLANIADFFITDPWTDTAPTSDWRSRFLTDVLRQGVNDNSQGKVTLASGLKMLAVLLLTLPVTTQVGIFARALFAVRDRVKRALWLDEVLFKIYQQLRARYKTEFSTLFLNGCAHVQHHYLHASRLEMEGLVKVPEWYFTADRDPILEAYESYDRIIQAALAEEGDVIVATALSQELHPTPIFYYRLRDHETFLRHLSIEFSHCHPRMTRDFLISFASNSDRDDAKRKLDGLRLRDTRLFGEIEVRNKQLFVVLTYPSEIKSEDTIRFGSETLPIGKAVVFVALKNGRHNGAGYIATSSPNVLGLLVDEPHVSDLFRVCEEYF